MAGDPQTPKSPDAPSSGSPSRRKTVLVVAVAFAALCAGWLSQLAVDSGSGSGSAEGTAATAGPGADTGGSSRLMALARRDGDDGLAMGRTDAPVVMIEYSDFGCPFCGKFARDVEPELADRYVKKGVLRIEWRNFPLFGAGSQRAARAGWAAGEQDRFWEFHEKLYADKDAKSEGFGTQQLTETAEQAGVGDLDRFTRDMDSEEARQAVRRDQEEGYGLGANSTPVFLINGRPVSGAQPEKTFTDVIDQAADQAADEAADRAAKGVEGE